jgi:hypothetical protein
MDNLQNLIEDALRRAPEWIRHDLMSKDKALQARAEETLAAMIAAALRQADSP